MSSARLPRSSARFAAASIGVGLAVLAAGLFRLPFLQPGLYGPLPFFLFAAAALLSMIAIFHAFLLTGSLRLLSVGSSFFLAGSLLTLTSLTESVNVQHAAILLSAFSVVFGGFYALGHKGTVPRARRNSVLYREAGLAFVVSVLLSALLIRESSSLPPLLEAGAHAPIYAALAGAAALSLFLTALLFLNLHARLRDRPALHLGVADLFFGLALLASALAGRHPDELHVAGILLVGLGVAVVLSGLLLGPRGITFEEPFGRR